MSREIDAEVAENVFHWSGVAGRIGYPGWFSGVPPQEPSQFSRPPMALEVPRYSSDMALAWTVVEELMCLGKITVIEIWRGFEVEPARGPSGYNVELSKGLIGWEAWATEPPLAICKAALSAIKSAGSDAGGK